MQNQRDICRFWKILFQRKGLHRDPVSKTPLLSYFIMLVGRRRQVLTTEAVLRLEAAIENDIHHLDEDEESQKSFQTCLSTFEDDTSYGSNSSNLPINHDLTFGHYISKSRLGLIACQCLEKMNEHFSDGHSVNEDTVHKYLTPGIGWEPREDEEGEDVLPCSHFDTFNGMWKADLICSDETSLMIDVMEMPWIYKKATKLIQFTEAVVTKDAICLYPKVLGFSFPTRSYWSREGRLMPRRDLRKGKARVTTVMTTFGFRQYIQWGQPYAGFAVAEGQLSPDKNNFEIVNWIQRYDGPHVCLRAVVRRHSD